MTALILVAAGWLIFKGARTYTTGSALNWRFAGLRIKREGLSLTNIELVARYIFTNPTLQPITLSRIFISAARRGVVLGSGQITQPVRFAQGETPLDIPIRVSPLNLGQAVVDVLRSAFSSGTFSLSALSQAIGAVQLQGSLVANGIPYRIDEPYTIISAPPAAPAAPAVVPPVQASTYEDRYTA